MCLTAFLNSQNTDLAAEIGKNLYVDNIMMTADTAEEALQKYRDSKILFAKIGMNLREYISNSNEVNSQIPIRDSLENGPLKFLGVNYNTILDNFKVMTHFRPVSQIAKKEIVNQINSVYDPIGLAAPLLVRLKAIMREVFEHKDLEWTDVLDLPICERWNKLCENVNNAVISVPRSISQQGFFHVDTSHNPADAGTRSLTTQEINNHDWLRGPRWLEQNSGTWPLRPIDTITEVANTKEERAISINVIAKVQKKTWNDLVDLTRFSTLKKALRTMATVGKVLKQWSLSTEKGRSTVISPKKVHDFDNIIIIEITSSDMELAEEILIATEQSHYTLEDLTKQFPDKKVIQDQRGIIRHESRLQNAYLPLDTKSPIFIPKESELVRLILLKIHNENAHCGKDHTLTIVRQRFWIPRLACAFKKYLGKCTTCKKYQRLPLGAPIMPPLPRDRVLVSKPFQNTGCDFMGPFTSKTEEKIGVPKIMRSDCGSNFKNGEHIIEAIFKKDDNTGSSPMTYCANERIKWIFNPPASPWMGGVWGRLVGSVKKAVNKSIGRRKLSFPEMCMVLTKIEAILNTRPLTKCDTNDITKLPLRPIDFSQRNIKYSIPNGSALHDQTDPEYDPTLIQTEKQALEVIRFSETIAEKFWESWKSQYLISLRENEKMNYKQPRHLKRTDPGLGEIVLIEQDLVPRGNWPYGKVVEVMTSADGLIRITKFRKSPEQQQYNLRGTSLNKQQKTNLDPRIKNTSI
ncbi:hypothetical protein RB195_006229 [Necator americanus]|uniref:Integrase catalytic domain-containing protein n=1 Tax=Necator americanus TaxID=51031 RepID=A0ABR1BRL0_NECAM